MNPADLIQIKHHSAFKKPPADRKYYEEWIARLEKLNSTYYEPLVIKTSLGKTSIWGINASRTDWKTLVIFPGFRTSSLFWDLDNTLAPLKERYRIFLVDTNGQPNLSTGDTPDIKSDGYGHWAHEVLQELQISQTVVAGASFGGLVCLKLCRVAPEKVEKAVLLNPGCLQSFSLSFKNLYYNLLPLIVTNRKNIQTFLDQAVFCKPNHQLSPEAEKLLLDYQEMAITRYRDRTQKPYAMSKDELAGIQNKVYLLVGDKDLLFPYQKSIAVAQAFLPHLQEVHVLPNTAHGIETSKPALQILAQIMEK